MVSTRHYLYRRISDLYGDLEREEKVHRKWKRKRIKRIRSYLDEHLFVEYKAGADLTDAFRQQQYSYASATLLTALCLEKYDVEYAAYVNHWKAYLVADPQRREISVFYGEEEKNERATQQSFRQDYLQVVRETILPDLPRLTGDDVANAFYENHYRPGKCLTFGQLIGYLEYTMAQAAYADGRYAEAIHFAESALRREDRAAFLVILAAAKIQFDAEVTPTVEENVSTLFEEWHHDPGNGYLPAALLRSFDERQRSLLVEGDFEAVSDLLRHYLAQAPTGQDRWRTQMRELQALRLLDHHYKSGNRVDARDLARQLYRDKPDDAQLRYLLGEIIVDQLRHEGPHTGEGFRRKMSEASQEYPFLKGHPRFIDLYLRDQAIKVRDFYDGEQPALAVPALQEFRESLLNLRVGEERNLWTLTAFAAASYYHFRNEDYKGAVAYIEEALRYAPQDQYLLHRLSVLRKYL